MSDFSPLAMLIKFMTMIAKVVVLTPPPVPPGEAPIHTKNTIKITVGNDNKLMFTELKPADLGTIELKRDVHILPINPCSLKTPLNSNIKKEKNPTKISIKVVINTILEFKFKI